MSRTAGSPAGHGRAGDSTGAELHPGFGSLCYRPGPAAGEGNPEPEQAGQEGRPELLICSERRRL